jgi:hypothetical protein
VGSGIIALTWWIAAQVKEKGTTTYCEKNIETAINKKIQVYN